MLTQATLGADPTEIERVRTLGYSAWIDAQFAIPRSSGYVDWLLVKGYDNVANQNNQAGANNMLWRKLIGSPDPLRQRVTLALSEIFVISISGLSLTYRAFASAMYVDILEGNAFGNVRDILAGISTSPAMGSFLTFRGNTKADLARGSLPDENYAREIMQLFTIGLHELNADGSLKLSGGQPIETYGQTDVSGLARVFTGWDLDTTGGGTTTIQPVIRPMVQIASRHELGAKQFLGTTIPANTAGAPSLVLALDTLFNHANTAPFLSRQLIQRLVTSNPSAAYVSRVAAAFVNNGAGVRGDLRAVIKAVLLDSEARAASGLTDPTFGKLREPVHRLVQWARSFGATSADDSWGVGDTSDPATRLGQSPLRAPSVFNFFRPGYVPPSTALGSAGLVAPELQITTETSVAGYLNFMQTVINAGVGGVNVVGYPTLLTLVNDSAALLAELNVLLAAGQLSASTLASLKTALDTISVSTSAGQLNRVKAALLLVMAAPEYIVMK